MSGHGNCENVSVKLLTSYDLQLTLYFFKATLYKCYISINGLQRSASAMDGCHEATLIKTDSIIPIRKFDICAKSDS